MRTKADQYNFILGGEMQEFVPGVWIWDIPHTFLGIDLGARMTLVDLGNKSMLLHSPIPINETIKEQISNLGSLDFIVSPNLFHHLYAGDYIKNFPDAVFCAPKKLAKKRRDLKIQHELENAPPDAWNGVLEKLSIRGSITHETIFLHKPSKTLICCDLTLNISKPRSAFTKFYLKVNGCLGVIAPSYILKWAYLNKKAGRESMDKMLSWNFENIIISHGDPIRGNGANIIRENYTWLS